MFNEICTPNALYSQKVSEMLRGPCLLETLPNLTVAIEFGLSHI